ncbi:MAG: hypothetical protein WC710_13745 [Gallionella sp.]
MTPEEIKAKNRERAKAYYWAHREERRAYHAAYHASHTESQSARLKRYRADKREKLNADGLAYRAANPEKMKALYKSYRETHSAERKAAWQIWYAKHREEKIAKDAAYRAANPEATRARSKAYFVKNKTALAKKARDNPEIGAMRTAKRRAAELMATPKWANHAEIKSVYREAAKLTKLTGIRHDVDHVIPVRGRDVCGLHVGNNLQILTKEANQRKSNKHDRGH